VCGSSDKERNRPSVIFTVNLDCIIFSSLKSLAVVKFLY